SKRGIKMSFTHLHVRSGYSLMESTIQIDTLVEQAKALNFSSLALTDFEVMHGAIAFYQACLKQGIKPILGMTIELKDEETTTECTLLAKNNLGYQNLLLISSHIQTNTNPFSLADLSPFSNGLFCIAESTDENIELLIKLQAVFNERFYLKIDTSHINNKDNIEALIKTYEFKPVVANAVRFLEEKDLATYDCLQAMKNGEFWDPVNVDETMQYAYLHSKEEANKFYKAFPHALNNTKTIAENCQVELTFNQQLLPKLPLKSETSKEELKRLCYEGLPLRYNEANQQAIVHFNYEIKIIKQLIIKSNDKYGNDFVDKISTFGTFGSRSLVRELMKTMNIDSRDQAYVLKNISTQSNQSLVDILRENEGFSTYVKQSSTLKHLFVHAIILEGLPRHASTHASGIILTGDQLVNHVPVMDTTEDVKLTQYAMDDLENLGLLKIDLLGLKNLSLIEHILESIKQTAQKQIDLSKIPKDDNNTFELLQKGKTNGVFQLESDGMKRVLKDLKPNELTDIIALNALYRPGPMDQIPTFINRKNNKAPVTYIHEDLKPILKDTYGVLVYQEQIMKIAHEIAG